MGELFSVSTHLIRAQVALNAIKWRSNEITSGLCRESNITREPRGAINLVCWFFGRYVVNSRERCETRTPWKVANKHVNSPTGARPATKTFNPSHSLYLMRITLHGSWWVRPSCQPAFRNYFHHARFSACLASNWATVGSKVWKMYLRARNTGVSASKWLF